ncbi:hypothetical protein B0H14DRAFT_3501151 [Mycena olivaceomarginata]|nr:hypothetical protein B0H14DRAFT_3501151 [Mycena olivaceomarginata]
MPTNSSEAARLRMQRHRTAVATSDIFTQRKYARKVALASERYRDRKRKEEHAERCAADAVTRQARHIEKDALYRKHAGLKKVLQGKPLPLPPLAKPPHPGKPPRTVFKPLCAVSPSSPTPAPRRAAIIPMPAIVQDDSSDSESADEREHHLPEPPIWPARTSRPQRCPHCYEEDCVGCACLCMDSDEWFDHPGGHYFPSCACEGEDCPGYLVAMMARTPLTPVTKTDTSIPAPFTQWFVKIGRGVVTSKESRSRMLECYPDAYTWEASPWWTFDRRWTLDCTEYHEHEGEHPVADELICPVTPDSGEPSSPSTLSESTASRAPSPAPPFSTEELAHLASFRPGPGPTSSARLTQQFMRVLGPQAVVLGKPPTASPAKRKTTLFAHEVATALHAGGKVILTAEGPAVVMPQDDLGSKRRKAVEGLVEEWTQENRAQGPAAVMYAVSGKRRIFQNRDHAVAVLKRSPGAELLFTNDEDELFEFLAEDLEGTLEA